MYFQIFEIPWTHCLPAVRAWIENALRFRYARSWLQLNETSSYNAPCRVRRKNTKSPRLKRTSNVSQHEFTFFFSPVNSSSRHGIRLSLALCVRACMSVTQCCNSLFGRQTMHRETSERPRFAREVNVQWRQRAAFFEFVSSSTHTVASGRERHARRPIHTTSPMPDRTYVRPSDERSEGAEEG